MSGFCFNYDISVNLTPNSLNSVSSCVMNPSTRPMLQKFAVHRHVHTYNSAFFRSTHLRRVERTSQPQFTGGTTYERTQPRAKHAETLQSADWDRRTIKKVPKRRKKGTVDRKKNRLTLNETTLAVFQSIPPDDFSPGCPLVDRTSSRATYIRLPASTRAKSHVVTRFLFRVNSRCSTRITRCSSFHSEIRVRTACVATLYFTVYEMKRGAEPDGQTPTRRFTRSYRDASADAAVRDTTSGNERQSTPAQHSLSHLSTPDSGHGHPRLRASFASFLARSSVL